jgi:hypothetical protein
VLIKSHFPSDRAVEAKIREQPVILFGQRFLHCFRKARIPKVKKKALPFDPIAWIHYGVSAEGYGKSPLFVSEILRRIFIDFFCGPFIMMRQKVAHKWLVSFGVFPQNPANGCFTKSFFISAFRFPRIFSMISCAHSFIPQGELLSHRLC